MTTETPYTPHPAKAFFGVFLSGFTLLGILNAGRSGMDPELARIVSGSNTAGVFLAAIVAAASVNWRLPIYAKVALFHILGAAVVGYLGSGSSGFAYALGSSFSFALIYALPCWLMLSRDWLIGRIVFWGLVAFFVAGLALFFVR